MPEKGQVLSNPITGDIYEFIETAKNTNGKRVSIKCTVKAKGQTVPNHIHVLQDEIFEVISGKLTIMRDGHILTLSAGEKIVLSKNQAHNHYNNEDTPVKYIHSATPALDFDYFFENVIGLAADGKAPNGKYGLMQELVGLKYIDGKIFLADIPIGIQKVMMELVGPIGRLLGYRAIYKKYSGIEK
jgi:quercetin dioxygenase-like cupin family protein